ncbi:hypothetical protein G6F36_015056 [Rhizopus arrhizus]|nr:hypothetical protein G6F36_015056 [Rhizopus arrhizus]
MTPSTSSSLESPDVIVDRRTSGTASSVHSLSSISSTTSKFSRSFSRLFLSTSPLRKHQQDMTCGSLGVVPLLTEKYGDYVTPQNRSKKGMGSTSKKNIASGATAVIRLVRQQKEGRILAVKEFKKRDKNEEDEKQYEKRMLNEYFISKTASNHPHIVETLDLVKDEKARWCVVMEYVSVLVVMYSTFYMKSPISHRMKLPVSLNSSCSVYNVFITSASLTVTLNLKISF